MLHTAAPEDAPDILASITAPDVCYAPSETLDTIHAILRDPKERVWVDLPRVLRIHLDDELRVATILWWQPYTSWVPREFATQLPILVGALREIVAEDEKRREWLLLGKLAEQSPQASKERCELVQAAILRDGQPFIVVEPHPYNEKFWRCRAVLGDVLDALERIA